MTDQLVTAVANFGLAVAGGEWGIAAMALEHRDSGAWREWRTAGETHPSTFEGFVEDFSERLRSGQLTGGVCLDVSSGKVLELIELFSWMSSLGFTSQQMAFVGVKRLRTIRREFRKAGLSQELQVQGLNACLAELETNGEAALFNDTPDEIKPELVMERLPDGRERLLGLVLWVNGAPQRNVFDPEKANWLTKRLRARKTYKTREQFLGRNAQPEDQ